MSGIDTRMGWMKEKNIEALERAYQEWIEQAAIERRKCERTRVPGSCHKMKYLKARECLQMANSYKAVIDRILEEQC